MPYEPPTPPNGVPEPLLDRLRNQSPDDLRRIAEYAEALAEHRDRESRLSEDGSQENQDLPDLDRPKGVPSKATVTTKTINENQYYYWQWRDGDKVKSWYIGPVDAAE